MTAAENLSASPSPSADLAVRWHALRAAEPQLRIRDAAARLGTTELELLATTVGATARWLDRDMAGLLHGLVGVGRCMALTRSESCVSEVRGKYGGVELGPHAGEHIDLRVFLEQWHYALAIDEPEPRTGGRRRSIQVFDGAGTAVHKVYLEADGGDLAAWDALVERKLAEPPILSIAPPAPRPPERPDAEVDVDALRASWDAMKDTHEFFYLLRKHKVARTQALRLAGETRARRVGNDAVAQVLGDSSETGMRIMIFVGNRGCLQVFSGPVHKVKPLGPWLNVMDPGFNLHLRADHVAASWVVEKPTASGIVRSLELYDAQGETIALLFRKRDDREQAEDPDWNALLARLPEAR
jgi:putative hemin transport protein